MIPWRTVAPSHGRAVVYALLASVLWSTGGLLVKLIAWHPLAIAGARSALAAALLVPFARIRLSRITWLTVVCGIAYALTMITYVIANRLTTAANTILLQYTAPIYVALLSWWLLGERVNLLDWGALVVVLVGVVLILRGSFEPGTVAGNLVALTSGVCFAVLLITLRMQKSAHPLDAIVIGNLIAAIVAVPWYGAPPVDARSWLAIAALGAVQLALPYIIYTAAVRSITAMEAILIKGIEPVLNPIWVLLFIGERPTILAVAGGALIVLAITGRRLVPLTPRVRSHRQGQ